MNTTANSKVYAVTFLSDAYYAHLEYATDEEAIKGFLDGFLVTDTGEALNFSKTFAGSVEQDTGLKTYSLWTQLSPTLFKRVRNVCERTPQSKLDAEFRAIYGKQQQLAERKKALDRIIKMLDAI